MTGRFARSFIHHGGGAGAAVLNLPRPHLANLETQQLVVPGHLLALEGHGKRLQRFHLALMALGRFEAALHDLDVELLRRVRSCALNLRRLNNFGKSALDRLLVIILRLFALDVGFFLD